MKWLTQIKPHVWALIGSLACLAYGVVTSNVLACCLATVLVTTLGQNSWRSWRVKRVKPRKISQLGPRPAANKDEKPAPRMMKAPVVAATPKDYIRNMIDQGRYALLLREEVLQSVGEDNGKAALNELESMMSHIVAGDVHASTSIQADGLLGAKASAETVRVEDFYIDRFVVTNEEFKRFVDDQGYANDELWSEEIRKARNVFVDKTGQPGPRFWRHGTYAPGEADHPVIGVSWYEAGAYARWQGKRLPTDTEWTKAASTPKNDSHLPNHQRKYPWGSTLEEGRANLWSTGIGTTVPVDEFEDGDNVCQVRQMVGNVWEWSADNFPGDYDDSSWQPSDNPLKSLRGGAFDTYFEHHVTCQSKSADSPSARKHNVGFRCALSTDDVTMAASDNI